jgi:hypothetical protein
VSILSTCNVNDVIAVKYGDKPGERICRVLEVRDLIRDPLSPKSLARRPDLQRGRRLVTCQATNGQIRAFYSGVEMGARPIPKLRAAWLYMRKKLPARKVIAK